MAAPRGAHSPSSSDRSGRQGRSWRDEASLLVRLLAVEKNVLKCALPLNAAPALTASSGRLGRKVSSISSRPRRPSLPNPPAPRNLSILPAFYVSPLLLFHFGTYGRIPPWLWPRASLLSELPRAPHVPGADLIKLLFFLPLPPVKSDRGWGINLFIHIWPLSRTIWAWTLFCSLNPHKCGL